jgi:two-component system sensor histidine kinase/response regulator
LATSRNIGFSRITSRFFAAMTAALLAMTVVIYLFAGWHERERVMREYASRMHSSVQFRAETLNRHFSHLKSDLRFLAELPSIQGTARAIGNNGYDAQEKLTQDFWVQRMRSVLHGYIAANEDFKQIIFAKATDPFEEVVSTERNSTGIVDMVAGLGLTQSQQNCAQNAGRLAVGHYYISDIGLNRSTGTDGTSGARQVCAATPLFDAVGKLSAVVIIIFNADQLLAEQQRNTTNELQRYLINANGDYLLHPDSSRTFGFESGRNWRWQEDFHPLTGDFSKVTGLLDYESEYGVVHVAADRVYLDEVDKTRYLTVIAALPENVIAHAVSAAQWLALLVTLGGGFSTGIIAFFFQRQQRKLHIHQARLGAIVESAHDAIISKSLDGTITSWNKGAERLFGYAEAEAIGRKLVDLIIPDECRGEEETILAGVARGATLSRFETVRQRKDGSVLMVSVSVAPIRDFRGRVVGASKTVHDISAQKATEAEILELNRSLERQVAERTAEIRAYASLQHAILTAAGYAIIATDTNGIITLFNPAAEKMLGYTAEEAVGNFSPIKFHDQDEITARTHEFSEQLAQPIKDDMEVLVAKSRYGLLNEHEWTFVHKNGARLPVWLAVSILRRDDGSVEGYLEMAVDISAQRAAEIAYKNNARFLGTLADNIPGMVGYWGQDFRCKFANRNYQEWFGCGPEEMQGMHLSELLGEALFQQNLPHVEAALRGEPQHFERVLTKVDGSVGYTWSHYIPDIADGQVRGFIVLVTDVTELKLVQLDIIELNRKLELRTNEAESASRAKSAFVANMSHEIRTPMNAVLGITDLLANTALSPEQKKYADMIRSAGESLLAILNDILDFSKIEAGKMELEPKEFVLEDLLQVLGTIMAVNAGQKNLELTIVVDPDVPNGLIGDSLRLQQVLTNLVGNAIKFTERGEVMLSVKVKHLADPSGIADKRTWLHFEVRDSGIGISEEQMLKLFSAFSQADTSTTRRFGGSGLGLTISKRLVELMDGEIGVDSQIGKGSRFWCTLPFDEYALPQKAKTSNTVTARLLLADANQTSLNHLHQLAISIGCEADCVSTYAEMIAQQRRREQQGQPHDAVLCDLRILERDPSGKLPPCATSEKTAAIVMTNGVGRGELDAHSDMDKFAAILIKPITASNLLDAINDVLGKHQLQTADSEQPAEPPKAKPLRGLRALLVEDNHFNQIVGRGLLERAGAIVTLAGDGSEAVDLLRTSHGEFDVVLMDIQMPVMDGFQATQIIREELKLKLPVLAMTAGVMVKERDRCINAGMDDFIAKPIDVEKMLAVLANYLPKVQEQVQESSPDAAIADTEVNVESHSDDLNGKKILDIDALIDANHDEDFLHAISQVVERVALEGMQTEAEISDAWRAGDIHSAMRLLHKSRGGVGSLGAQRWSELTMRVENLLHDQKNDEAAQLMPRLRREMELVVHAAQAWLAKQQPRAQTETMDTELLSQFLRALSQSNMVALEQFSKLRALLAQHLSTADMEQLNLHMRDLEFEQASELVAHLYSFCEP